MVAKQVSELSHQHFDAQKLDALEEEPEWLQPMCAERRWRTLLYDLFAANPDCKLLKATVGELSKGEHASEVAAHPGLLALIGGASSLQAFLGSLGTQLHGRRHGHTMQEGLDGVACAGEAQFFCAQLLLRTAPLATLGSRTQLEKAAARMADAAAATHGAAGARRLQLLAAGVPRESALLSSLVSVLIAGVITPADAQTLCSHSEMAISQSEMAISQSEMASSQSSPTGVGAAVRFRVAPAGAVSGATSGAVSEVPLDGAVSGTIIALHTDDPSAVYYTVRVDGTGAERQTTADRLELQAQAVCEKNEVSDIGASVALLHRCIDEPAAACGILHWALVVLTTARFSGARYNASFAPDVIKLVLAIGARHGALRDAACTLLHACLVHEPETDSENNALSVVAVRRLLLDGLLLLLARGYALPVLATLHAWIAGSDLSLTRHLLQQLVALVAPPYSRPFAVLVLAIVRHPRTLEAHRGLGARQPLVSFAQQARAVAGLEETADEVLALLQA
ncbi:hypothetical protein Ctob_010015 [Chrysochromulina tobinii]|uniref:Uncharacterized protein n=1 Tax=Chrysochromulina tobinii TaxID=1460289 RepID=A0A0M0JXU4_9EUKA|nr:hypothetical protein Ctob_010015 [Chrysochromulina tobinii]|eukprot:KOO31399.1 hypothetical protein Ctob_010015 [Chrysochromulina sp. CCMP291]